MPTLKQLKTIEALPKNDYNIAKSMRQSGYTEASVRAGTTYQALRRITQKMDFFSPEKIKRDVEYTYKLAKKQKDITNMSRNVEFRGKIAGMIVDKTEELNKQADKVVIVYGEKVVNKADNT
jgi:hypothetical protein